MDAVERVRNMVRHSLVASPNVTNQELYDRAREIAPQAVEGLSLRQFHARYRLPVMVHEMGRRKRRSSKSPERSADGKSRSPSAGAGATGAGTRKPRGTRTGRKTSAPPALQSEVRDVLVEFAVKLENAESRGDLVQVMAGVDEFAARILRIVNGNGAAARTKEKKVEPDAGASANGSAASLKETETPVTRTAA